MTDSGGGTLSNLLHEERRFPPPPELASAANATAADYARADAARLAFWAAAAGRLDWERPWDQVLDWSRAPFARWFTGGRLNAAHKSQDR
ncbi:acetyl-coenzyme A synthetase N-terminal domain-containing protein, partial [Streptomyces sp. NPDC127079]|uniref:acetyl-coenzyme A synthetase N-terminal domain-containing protein n=1 Tax=Streptomyces sp. NPDC127079 TaxID=3347132 RepID=UPI0036522DEC